MYQCSKINVIKVATMKNTDGTAHPSFSNNFLNMF